MNKRDIEYTQRVMNHFADLAYKQYVENRVVFDNIDIDKKVMINYRRPITILYEYRGIDSEGKVSIYRKYK